MRFALLSATCEVPSFVLHFPRHRDERDRQYGLLRSNAVVDGLTLAVR